MRKSKIFAASLFIAALAFGGVFATGPSVQAQADAVTCSPSSTTVRVGQAVTLAASGGGDDATYTWSSPGLTITDPTGENFTATFSVAGDYVVTLEGDNGETDTCAIAVTATEVNPGTPAPGLPNTGELPQ